MILESDRLRLVLLSRKELDGPYISWLNDQEVCRYNSHGEIEYTRQKALEFLRGLKGDRSREVYAVYLKFENIHIGNISLQRINRENDSAEIAFLFGDKRQWGKGYATEAGKLLLDRAFSGLKLRRVYFGTHIDNIGMQKVGKRLGFENEGVLKNALKKNGTYSDAVLYGIVR